jgi:hypothetical protein
MELKILNNNTNGTSVSQNPVNLYQESVALLTNINFNMLMSSCTIMNQEAPDERPHELIHIILPHHMTGQFLIKRDNKYVKTR